LLFVAAFKILLDLLLKTKVGFMLRATGKNEQMVTSLGKDVGVYKIIGLAVANALVAMGGAVYSQWNNYYDGQSGQGMVVIALASVIIGCSIFKNAKHIKGTTSAIIGAIIYGICLYLATFIIDSMYLKLIMAALFTIVLAVNTFLLKDKKTSLRFNIKETAKK
jgi:putative ABC transport system permease protein